MAAERSRGNEEVGVNGEKKWSLIEEDRERESRVAATLCPSHP